MPCRSASLALSKRTKTLGRAEAHTYEPKRTLPREDEHPLHARTRASTHLRALAHTRAHIGQLLRQTLGASPQEAVNRHGVVVIVAGARGDRSHGECGQKEQATKNKQTGKSANTNMRRVIPQWRAATSARLVKRKNHDLERLAQKRNEKTGSKGEQQENEQ